MNNSDESPQATVLFFPNYVLSIFLFSIFKMQGFKFSYILFK